LYRHAAIHGDLNALSLSTAKLSQKKTTKRDEQNVQDRHKALILGRIKLQVAKQVQTTEKDGD
jgi:hypothetical protein